MRNPNGYGSIIKLSGNRRRPYAVRVTDYWDDEGKQHYKMLSYHATKKDAMIKLASYNSDPNLLDRSDMTVQDVYDLWSAEKYPKSTPSTVRGYGAAWNHLESIKNLDFGSIKTSHLQSVIDKCAAGHGTRRKVKILMSQLYKYAMQNDIAHKDYAKYVEVGEKPEKSKRKVFSQGEINKLRELVYQQKYIDTILIMIYTGMRVGEMLSLRPEHIDMELNIIRTGSKTKAGINRIIPIHDSIKPLLQTAVQNGAEYVFPREDGRSMSYDYYYRSHFAVIMKELGMQHLPHDCRHTFITRMGDAGADMNAIKEIVGHAHYSTTADVYTHKDLSQLEKAIKSIN